MNSQRYWERRKERELYDELAKAEDVAEELRKIYLLASEEIQEEVRKIARRFQLKHALSEAEAQRLLAQFKSKADIARLIQELKKNPRTAELAAELEAQAYAARIARLQAIQHEIDVLTASMLTRAKNKVRGVLERIAKSMYLHEIFGLQKRVGAAFGVTPIDRKKVESIINRDWSGANYSKRLWKDTDKLAETVKEQILLDVLTGKREHDIASEIQERFSVGYNEARRLIRTEACYVANQAQIEAYKDHGVEKYIYLATLDMRTSEICRSLDKKTFDVDDAMPGLNCPPMHPWCRSTTMAWMPPELMKKMQQAAWDPVEKKTITVPANMTYQQWYDKYVKGGEEPADRIKNSQAAPPGRNLTRQQYERYKDRLGDNFPLTYDEFVKMKADKERWEKYKRAYMDARKPEVYEDITDEWRPKTPFPKDISDADVYVYEGKEFYPDGHHVKFEYDSHEKEIGELVSSATGNHVDMLPKVNYPKGIPSADYLIDNETYMDLKTLENGAGPNTIFNRISKSKRQANTFIIDVTESGLSDDIIESQITKVYKSKRTENVTHIVVVRDMKIERVTRKK